MSIKIEGHSKKRRTLLAWYNLIPNLIWSVLNLTPILVFFFTLIELRLIYIFLALSFIPAFLKNSIIDKLQIGKTTRTYKKLGVHLIKKVSQNGDIINALLKKKFPEHKILANRKKSISALINQTNVFEKFHLILFLFFSLIVIYSIINEYWIWAFTILFTSIAYNVYPNFLQQYIRLKLSLFEKTKMEQFKNLPNR
jgi:Glycosyl-4,4'-diaponeurosporenoate acyltransferase